MKLIENRRFGQKKKEKRTHQREETPGTDRKRMEHEPTHCAREHNGEGGTFRKTVKLEGSFKRGGVKSMSRGGTCVFIQMTSAPLLVHFGGEARRHRAGQRCPNREEEKNQPRMTKERKKQLPARSAASLMKDFA